MTRPTLAEQITAVEAVIDITMKLNVGPARQTAKEEHLRDLLAASETIIAIRRLSELDAAITNAPGWGAGVAAMLEERETIAGNLGIARRSNIRP